jgi:hypothetical protein
MSAQVVSGADRQPFRQVHQPRASRPAKRHMEVVALLTYPTLHRTTQQATRKAREGATAIIESRPYLEIFSYLVLFVENYFICV